MVRSLVAAGADADFSVDEYVPSFPLIQIAECDHYRWTLKRYLMDFSLASLLEHPTTAFTHQVRTSTLAIELCQSVLGIDIAEVVEHTADGSQYSQATRMALTQPHLDSPPDIAHVIIEASGCSSTLEYAVNCLPAGSALQHIQEGRMPMDGAPLTYATGSV